MARPGGRDQFKDSDWNRPHHEVVRDRPATRPQQTRSAAVDDAGTANVYEVLEAQGAGLGTRRAAAGTSSAPTHSAGDTARTSQR